VTHWPPAYGVFSFRGFGFVTFDTEDEAQACLDSCPHTIDGSSVELKRPKPKGEVPSKDMSKTVNTFAITNHSVTRARRYLTGVQIDAAKINQN
jgi:hypothetical protein